MPRILFVNRFCWPETPATAQLLTDLASGTSARGHETIVITSRGHLAHPPVETHHGVTIVRTSSPRWVHGTILGKAIAFASFLLGAMCQLLRQARRGDTIVAMTDPPLLGIVACFAGRMRGANVIHWVQDIYPEVAVAVTGHTWLRLLSPLRNVAWRRAAACVVLSEEMSAVVAGAGVERSHIVTIPNWAPAGVQPMSRHDPAVCALRKRWALDGKFVVMYSGNLGRVHDLATIAGAAAILRDDTRIVFVFVGHGAQRRPLEAEVAHRNLSNVKFFDPQPREQLATSLGVGDIHLVTLRPGCEPFVFPSKLYGIAAVARGVVFVGPPDCEMAQLVRRHGLGATIATAQADALATEIHGLAENSAQADRYAAAAAVFAAAHSTPAALTPWLALLENTRCLPASVAMPTSRSIT